MAVHGRVCFRTAREFAATIFDGPRLIEEDAELHAPVPEYMALQTKTEVHAGIVGLLARPSTAAERAGTACA